MENKVKNLRRFNAFVKTTPLTYLDFNACFFFIVKESFVLVSAENPVLLLAGFKVRTIKLRTISPFLVYLNFVPLYVIWGGSTIWAEPFTKRPSWVERLQNPLYKWNIFTHLTFVPSAKDDHDSFNNTLILVLLFENFWWIIFSSGKTI